MASDADRRGARIAALLSFTSFFVFPAVPVGRTGALTISFALAAVLAALWLPRLRAPEWAPYLWVLVPAGLSGVWVLGAGAALAPEIVPKAVIAFAMPLLVLVPARHLLRAGHGEPFLRGAAWAIVVQAALGIWQVLAFARGEFPYQELMRTNPAQALLTEDVATYVEYVKRPFGLFAEPSAMAACVGPWLVLLASAIFSRGRGRTRADTGVLALALAGGLWLVVASKTGLAVPIVAGTAAVTLGAAFSWRRGAFARAAALVASAAIAIASVVWLTENAAARFELARNDSWQARLESLKLGARAIAASADSPGRFVAGVGPGQSFPAIHATAVKYEAGSGVEAVWSIGVNYAMETGLLGIVAMLVLAAWATRSVWASHARLAGAAFAVVWLAGVSLATSYAGQPALWTGLAALLTWRSVTTR